VPYGHPMVDPKPLRPRARRESSLGKLIERVSVDIVDLRVLETELSAIGPVEVKSDQFDGEGASVDAFTEHGYRSLEDLSLYARNPDNYSQALSLDLNRERAFIYNHDRSDHLLAGVELRAEQICRARVRRSGVWGERLCIPLFFLTILVGCLSVAVASEAQRAGATTISAWWLVAVGVCLALALTAAALSKFVRGEILLVSREEAPGWLVRNRDGLLVQIVGGAVVLVLGFVLGRVS
jgi:hypothetical protein